LHESSKCSINTSDICEINDLRLRIKVVS
jgi:hypothetical protein